jgi:hypothetical protein
MSAGVTKVFRTGLADRAMESLERRSLTLAVTTNVNFVHDRLGQRVLDGMIEFDIRAEVIRSGVQARFRGFALLLFAGTVGQTTVEDIRKVFSVLSRFQELVSVEVADFEYARQLFPPRASGSAFVEQIFELLDNIGTLSKHNVSDNRFL